jgi:hypothetical protein
MSDPVAVTALENQGVTFPPGIDPADVSASYFSNGADTKTYGADLTTAQPESKVILGGTWHTTSD